MIYGVVMWLGRKLICVFDRMKIMLVLMFFENVVGCVLCSVVFDVFVL